LRLTNGALRAVTSLRGTEIVGARPRRRTGALSPPRRTTHRLPRHTGSHRHHGSSLPAPLRIAVLWPLRGSGRDGSRAQRNHCAAQSCAGGAIFWRMVMPRFTRTPAGATARKVRTGSMPPPRGSLLISPEHRRLGRGNEWGGFRQVGSRFAGGAGRIRTLNPAAMASSGCLRSDNNDRARPAVTESGLAHTSPPEVALPIAREFIQCLLWRLLPE
jgi:hypothetical protein